ncbi:MAG: Mur ligase family protein [Syntrophotaleaceae bacterium]
MASHSTKKSFFRHIHRKGVLFARKLGLPLKIKPHISTACITGSVGKTTTCRMVASILREAGKTVALSTTQGTYVGDSPRRFGDSSNGRRGSRLLVERQVDAAVFEIARGGLIDEGMLFSGYDVGAMLNVYDNHLGLKGVESRADLAKVKKQVVINARKMVVLNADDPFCLGVKEEIRAARTCLITMTADSPVVRDHMSSGGVAVRLEGSGAEAMIRLYEGDQMLLAMAALDIPASWGGRYRPAINNAMFAAAITYGLDVSAQTIRAGLGSFRSDEAGNPGRMNFYDHLPYKLLITWADGPEAACEIARFVSLFPVSGKKHLMLAAMGNRPDAFIVETALALSGRFDSYISTDWEDLRGRGPGEVAKLLASGFKKGGVDQSRIEIATSHEDALVRAFAKPSQGDLLVIVSFSGWKAKEQGLLKGTH